MRHRPDDDFEMEGFGGPFAPPDADSDELRKVFGAGATEPKDYRSMFRYSRDLVLDLVWNDIVDGIFGPGDLIVMYGPSNVGKTFAALAIAHKVATEQKIAGRETQKTAVLYVTWEGKGGFTNRLIAAREAYGDPGNEFGDFQEVVTLGKGIDGAAGVADIIGAAKALLAESGAERLLIVIDTLARAIAGDDENLASDMASFVEQRCGVISQHTGAAVMVVHHSGKDESQGARGSSALRAAADCELHVKKNHIAIEKSRDYASGGKIGYKLRTVELGRNTRDRPIESCVVDFSSATEASEPTQAKLTDRERRAKDHLNAMYADREDFEISPSELGGKAAHKTNVVRLDDLKARLRAAGLTAEGASAQTQRTAIVRAIEGLANKENVQYHGDFVWICGQPKPQAHKAHKGAQFGDVVRPVNGETKAHIQTPPSKRGGVCVRMCSTPHNSEVETPSKNPGASGGNKPATTQSRGKQNRASQKGGESRRSKKPAKTRSKTRGSKS
jgi:hypothetical protein